MGDGTEKNSARPCRGVAEALAGPGEAGTRGRWEFTPYLRSDRRREEVLAFRDRLVSALRAGHGLGASFLLRLDAGPEPGLSLSVESATAHRWVVRALAGAYGPSQWTSGKASGSERAEARWVASRVYPWPHPLRLSTDGAPLTDVLALSAAALPRGIWLELRATPLPLSDPAWWESMRPGPRELEAGFGPRNSVRAPEPRRTERPEARFGPPLFWALGATVGIDAPQRARDSLRVAARTFERASRGGSGNGLAFRPRWSLRWWWAPAFPVAEEELALLFPGPECPCASARRRARPDPTRIPLGRSRAGAAIGPDLEPDQGRHLAVLGETGMGKSSLLVSLAVRASRDAGLVLFDPLGETATAFAREIVGAGRVRLIRIDPERHPVRINALEGVGPGEADPVRSERRLNDLVHALRRVRAGRYVDSSYWGPRLEEMLTRALLAAAAFEHGTLSDAHLLLATCARSHRDLPSTAMGPVRELADRNR